MRIGLISDTHDHLIKINEGIKFFNWEKVDYVIHCGDFVAPFALKLFENLTMPFIGVFGNNDGEKEGLKNVVKNIGEIYEPPISKEFNSKNFLISHSPVEKQDLKKYGDLHYVIFGHTHKKEIVKASPLLINPGECCGWLTGVGTVAILDTETDNVVFKNI